MALKIPQRTILIVDDIPLNVQTLSTALKSAYRVVVAGTGPKALEMAASDPAPDLILLDIMMPDMDGMQVLKRLKEDAHTREIPVIFVTGKGEAREETLGLEMGAVDYITKPFDLSIVKARVKTQLALKQKTEMLEKLVSLDGLTEIPNRRRFDEVFQNEWRRAKRNRISLSLIMIDIDHFKDFNDRYGHAVGDECLKAVAQKIKETLNRAADFVARYGGEEFAVVLPETDFVGAVAVAENIQSKMAFPDIAPEYLSASYPLTLSLGVAAIHPGNNADSEELLTAADKMLYEAKKKGRNRIKSIDLDK